MPRPRQVADGLLTGGNCNIRKRFLRSSSSSSSSIHGLKHAAFACKRTGLSTPFPAWKMDTGSISSNVEPSELSRQLPSSNAARDRQGPVSARKLANALWELQKIPVPTTRGGSRKKRCKEVWRREGNSGSVRSGSLPSHLSDPSHSPVSEVMDRSGTGWHRRRLQWLNSSKLRCNGHNVGFVDSPSFGGLMEMETHSRGHTARTRSSGKGTKSSLKDLIKGLNASKEFLNVLDHFYGFRKNRHPSIVSIFSALCSELDRSHVLVDRLMEDQRHEGDELGYLNRQKMEEVSMWKVREQEKIKEGVRFLLEKLEIEKKLRRRNERQNEKLSMELAQAKAALSKTTHDLENERRSRELIEHVCNELVRGIGEDKAEVEVMKQESAMIREELEREREMLQLADTWREERVHMKLTEAKFQLEEKNAAVDQLRTKLEAFLADKRSSGNQVEMGTWEVGFGSDELQRTGWGYDPISSQKIDDVGKVHVEGNEDGNETDSCDSDLHSIELNMDNGSKSYCWSFAKQDIDGDDIGRNHDYEALTKSSFSASQRKDLPFDCRFLSDTAGVLRSG